MPIGQFAKKMNQWGREKIPFLFLVDFEMEKPLVFRLDELKEEKILYDINGLTNCRCEKRGKKLIEFAKYPLSLEDYKRKYDIVHSQLLFGNSYLTNLTIRTRVKTPLSIREIFHFSRAKYKVVFENSFLVFSPESFVRIEKGRIRAYPMKGTIEASIPEAKEKILTDGKEMAEHVTIVDLIRNDLSTVAHNVEVTRFRYVEEIRTTDKDLLQVSSEIGGDLPSGYERYLGDIILKLLPAGSVSGAPKRKTMEIIRGAENERRGYYTGVVGVYDGQSLDSGVMIRFIESEEGAMYYRSGGGITVQSTVEKEYQEAIDKVYVPVD